MLTVADAQDLVIQHLGDSSRARHSVFVGYAMRRLADHLGEDAVTWHAVGLVHDIDFEATRDEPARHGRLASEWLKGRLPDDALTAIAAHDHRSGVTSDSALACALRLADALAVACKMLGQTQTADLLDAPDATALLAERFTQKPYLPRLLWDMSERVHVENSLLAGIARAAPPPG